MSWQDDALCLQVDPELWFPDKGGNCRPAVRVCQQCPVRAECLDEALTHDYRTGIWGGLTVNERKQLRRGRKEAAA